MEIKTLTVGIVATSCYILGKEGRDDCLVIDPGAEADRIRRAAEGKRIAAILLTHGHFDHIGGVQGLMDKDTRLLIHSLDAPMLSDPALNASAALLQRPFAAPAPTDLLRDGEKLTLAGLPVEVIHTPGHTPGSVCFRIEDHLFTGDTLFEYGWGRTDLPGGDEQALYASLRRIAPLAESLPIHPGHDT